MVKGSEQGWGEVRCLTILVYDDASLHLVVVVAVIVGRFVTGKPWALLNCPRTVLIC